jgi:hypothetical protein
MSRDAGLLGTSDRGERDCGYRATDLAGHARYLHIRRAAAISPMLDYINDAQARSESLARVEWWRAFDCGSRSHAEFALE